MNVSFDQLKEIMPRLKDSHEKYVVTLNDAMAEFEINTVLRQAAFIAQIAHESGEFRYTREIWGPTKAQEKYKFRADLGNTAFLAIEAAGKLDVGFFYRGGGLIQITGAYNYKACGEALGIDLFHHPDLIIIPKNSTRAAGWFWHRHGLNEIADDGKFKRITRTINGGLNGYEQRVNYYVNALEVLNYN